MLKAFCQFIRYINNSVIIIDQYKEDYDKNKKLYNLMKDINNQKIKKMKFIISSSLNDNSVKEELRIDLMYIFKNEISEINFLEKSNNKEKSIDDLVEELFNNFQFDDSEEDEVDDNDNNDLTYISLPNIPKDVFKSMKPEDKKEKKEGKEDNIEEEKNLVLKFKLTDSDKKLIEVTEIIYVNNLISIESLVKDEDEKKLYKIFNFNPKTYKKYSKFYQVIRLSQ